MVETQAHSAKKAPSAGTSGNTLRINPGADRQTLSNVLSILREAGLC